MTNRKHIQEAKRRDETVKKRNARRETNLALKQFCGTVVRREYQFDDAVQETRNYLDSTTQSPRSYGLRTIGDLNLL